MITCQQALVSRLHYIDLLRGLIIVLMITDHAMVYCLGYSVTDPIDVVNTEPKVFFTRFVSHFCAPLFVFLAGLSAAMTESRYTSSSRFAKDLIIRGVVLIVLEFTLVSWSWSFNPLFPMLYAQVIWAIGWGFIGLGLLRLAGMRITFLVAVVLVFAHNLLDGWSFPSNTTLHYLWSVLHQKNVLDLPFGFKVRTTYPILPIMGLLCLGYLLGSYKWGRYQRQPDSRFEDVEGRGTEGRLSGLPISVLWYGLACICTYAILRGFNLYGDPGLFTTYNSPVLTVMSFLNPTKYPLSLQFMLLTVGMGFILLFLFSRLRMDFSVGFLQALGKTSMFSYLAHLYLLHAISWLLIPVMGYQYSDMTYGETLIGLPETYGFSYVQSWFFIVAVVGLTTWLARIYLPWKKANKETLIALYI